MLKSKGMLLHDLFRLSSLMWCEIWCEIVNLVSQCLDAAKNEISKTLWSYMVFASNKPLAKAVGIATSSNITWNLLT